MKHFQYILFGLLLVLAVIATWQVRGCTMPGTPAGQVDPDTIYAERTITLRDTIRHTVPDTRTIYERTRDTVYIRIPVPDPAASDFLPNGVVSTNPIYVDDGSFFRSPSITLTYWQPDSLRFEQAQYDVPTPSWALWPDVGAEYVAGALAVRARANLRWQRLHFWGGYHLTAGTHGPAFGVTWRPLGTWRW